MSKLIILHYETQEVIVCDYDENVWEDPEEFMSDEQIDINSSSCHWMVVDKLVIKYLKNG